MSKPDSWLPLYVADYMADTTRLTTEQHGAYLLLLMDYWRNGPPPDDNDVLARITGLTASRWKAQRKSIERFFSIDAGVWRQKRADFEMNKAREKSEAKQNAGRAGAGSKWGSGDENKIKRSERLAAARSLATHTDAEWSALIVACGANCLRCGAGSELVKDHIKPMYQGGSDGVENLQPLCRSCNASKGPDSTDMRPTGWLTKIRASLSEESAERLANALRTPTPLPSPSPSPTPSPPPSPNSVPTGSAKSADPPSAPAEKRGRNGTSLEKTERETLLTAPTWSAFAFAYRARYSVDPVRNATVNAQISQLVKRLGEREAPAVASFYVKHNGAYYVRSKHSVGALLKDCEGLRTEWASGRTVTDTEARQLDRKQNNLSIAQTLIAEEEAKNGQ